MEKNIVAFLIAIIIGVVFYGVFIKEEKPEEIIPEEKKNQIVLEEENKKEKENFDIQIDKNSEEVQIKRLKEGSGAKVEKGDKVTIHYEGRLIDGTLFDSSIKKDSPLTFTLGQRQVIPGMEAGTEGMKVGEKRRLFIPPKLGYGSQGKGPIPPNSILVFDIELLKIN